jgi:CBS domain-containing protein
MQAKDVMTHPVISVSTQASILEAVRLMLQHKISGLPVFDESGKLAGIVSEGDFLRRAETDTLRRRPRWIEFFVGPGKLADEYVHASTRKVSEVMTADVHTVSENAPLNEVVTIMEQNQARAGDASRGGGGYRRPYRPSACADKRGKATPVGRDGIVTFSGFITDERERRALCTAAENIPGVKTVEDQLAWLVPGTGIMVGPVIITGSGK